MKRRGDVQNATHAAEAPATTPARVGSPSHGSRSERLPIRFRVAYSTGSEIIALSRDPAFPTKVVRRAWPVDNAVFFKKTEVKPEHLAEIRTSRFVKGIADDGAHWRISFDSRWSARKAADPEGWFAKRGMIALEADVDPVRRWMVDTGAELERPRRCYLDLETDDRLPFNRGNEARILCWAVVDADGNRFGQALEADTDAAESELLRQLFATIAPYDLVLAWNGDRFDFPRIGARAWHCRVKVELRRWLWLDHMKLFNKLNVSASQSGDEKQFAGLEAVASALKIENAEKKVHLGQMNGPTTWGMWEVGGEQREALLDYCIDDTWKMHQIEERTGYVDLHETVCLSTGSLPDSRGMRPTVYVEAFMLRIGAARGLRFPSRWFDEEEVDETGEAKKEEKFRGAFVLEPRTGILRDVHVCDFARLYPSCIVTWNMSLETRREDVSLVEKNRPTYLSHLPVKRRPLPPGTCVAPITDVVFDVEPLGVLPEAILEMLRLRKYWDTKKKECTPGTDEWREADRRSSAYKICANSFYGVVGSQASRFFVREVAESVAQAGVHLIKSTFEVANAKHWEIVGADTDSAFVIGPTRDEFSAFVDYCNAEVYPPLLKAHGCTKNAIEIAYEKAFRVMVSVGKKRYAAKYWHYKGKDADETSEPEIKGLEYKRGDSARLGRRMQEEIIKLLLTGEGSVQQCIEIVERYRAHVLEGVLVRSDVVLSKRISKSLREYVSKKNKDGSMQRLSPHIEVARLLAKQGKDVGPGTRIEYVVTDAAADPPLYSSGIGWDVNQPFDRHYLWETMVYRPTLRVLEAVFALEQWSRWERSRPPKVRGRAVGNAELPGLEGPAALPVAAKKDRKAELAKKAQEPKRGKGWDAWQQKKLFD